MNYYITSVLGKQVSKRNFSSLICKQSYRLPNVQNGFYCLLRCLVGIVQPKADPWCCLHFTKYKFNVYRKKYIRSGRDSAVVGIVGKSKSLDFLKMLIFWYLVRNSVVLAVYLLFSVACFFTVHEHYTMEYLHYTDKLNPIRNDTKSFQ